MCLLRWASCCDPARPCLVGCLLAAVLGAASVVAASDGDLDPTWGFGGAALVGPPGTWNEGNGVALQCDGKVVVTGRVNADILNSELAVLRLDANGSPDTGFGSGGLFSIGLSDGYAVGRDVAIQPDGKIVVVGWTRVSGVPGSNGANFLVLRLTTTGALDPTFSGDGYHTFQFGDESSAHAVALQDDGRIVVVGSTVNTSGMAVARLTTAGDLDATFDTDGQVIIDFTLGEDSARDVAIQDDGRILVAGAASLGGTSIATVVRLLGDGSLDTSFGPGSGGATGLNFGSFCEAWGLAVQDDGRIVVAGVAVDPTGVAVGRLTTAGLLDPTFGGDGTVTQAIGGVSDEGWSVAVQRDQRIVVSGLVNVDGVGNAAVMRFDAAGALDSGFGSGGVRLLSFPGASEAAAVLIHPSDGRIITAGTADVASLEWRILIARLIGDGSMILAADFECGDTAAWSSVIP
jgi:uncharacterized delta-60 repeat protein